MLLPPRALLSRRRLVDTARRMQDELEMLRAENQELRLAAAPAPAPAAADAPVDEAAAAAAAIGAAE